MMKMMFGRSAAVAVPQQRARRRQERRIRCMPPAIVAESGDGDASLTHARAPCPLRLEGVGLHVKLEQGLIDGAPAADHFQEWSEVRSKLRNQDFRGDRALSVCDDRLLLVEPAEPAD